MTNGPDPRAAELVAVRSMYPESRVECEDRDFEAAVRRLERGGEGDDEACEGDGDSPSSLPLARRPCRGAVRLHVAADYQREDGAAAAGAVAAELSFELPPGYPSSAATPARCRAVACDALPRRAVDALAAALQRVADEAAAAGRGECLHELVAALEEGVRGALALEQQQAPQCQQQQQQQLPRADSAPDGGGGGGGGGGATGGRQRVVLRLAHMRDRAGYVRTMRRWAKELGLAGRLVECGGRVFVALEGARSGVGEYLVRARTRNVDVDAAGRKCRERLMDVVADECLAGSPAAPDGGGSFEDFGAAGGGGSVAAAASALGVDERALLSWLGL